MTFEEIDDRLDLFEAKLQEELQRNQILDNSQVASEYEPVDCDPPPVVF